MIIHSKRIYMEDGLKSGYLEIEGKKIKNFYPEGSDVKADVDYGNNRIIPGIFDTHNHGGFGYSLIDDGLDEKGLKAFLKGEASYGVVNILATASFNNFKLISDFVNKDVDGTRILGIHSEGPWGARVGEKGVNTGYPKVDLEYGQKMIDEANGTLVLVDVAPEVEHGLDAIKFFKDHGITVGMYHTNANYKEANAGVDAGVSVATHLGNVMTGLHHRDVGVLGTGLLRDEVDCEMICDGLHISLPMLQIYLKVKDHNQLMMISDNVSYAGAPKGRYKGTFDAEADRAFINVTEEGFVLSDSGRLSGSAKPVLYGIYNLVEKLGVPMEECCKFFSYNPVRKYSDPNKKGSLKANKDADFVVISDDYNVIATYSEGNKVYDKDIDKDLFDYEFVKKYKLD